MQTSIEEINGKQCTVIRKPFCADYVREQLATLGGVWSQHFDECTPSLFQLERSDNGKIYYCDCADERRVYVDDVEYFCIILPALPRNPTEKDAPLLYRYMAEGVVPMGLWKSKVGKSTAENSVIKMLDDKYIPFVTSGATDANGEPLDVAIEGGVE